jgi:MarR family transcriptional regulator, organic hydroperoxide resistance regulator
MKFAYAAAMAEFLALFTRASKLMRGAADDAMSRHGVRVGQNLVLAALWDHDGLAPGEVAKLLGVRTPTIVKMATRMEAAGLIERRRDAKDARLVRLYLTGKGRSLQAPIESELRGLEARALASVNEREQRQLERALGKIVGNLEGVAPPEEDTHELA